MSLNDPGRAMPGPIRRLRARMERRVGVALGVCLAGALAASILAAPPARATVYSRIDFEVPGYGAPPRRMSDHYLLKNAGVWHLFYAELLGPAGPNKIGHAVSTDLIHWTEHATVLSPGGAPWRSFQVWAPSVIALPSGGWRMFYTGQNDAGSEVIGSLTSSDLDTWTPDSPDPAYVPPPGWVRWGSDFSCACRDPYVYADSGHWTMIYTCDTNVNPHQPALGIATSSDLLTWTEAGPLVIDSTSSAPTSLESPSLFMANGRAELHYTRFHSEMLTAPTLAGPWDVAQSVAVDSKGGADEWPIDGNVHLFSRVRHDTCQPGSTLIVIDTVTSTPTGYSVPVAPAMPAGWTFDGDAFGDQPVYGDGPALRGGTPAAPGGLRWLGTGESRRCPDSDSPCASPAISARTGWARSPAFTLTGDLVSFRLMGRTSTDSAFVQLLDDCTGVELARQTGPNTDALTPFAWSNTGRRGWRVRMALWDKSSAPGNVIGLDDVADSAVGNPTPPTQPLIDETTPAGGENYSSNSSVTLRWTGSATAGIDSFCVFLSYDDFATAPTKIAKRNANQFTFSWTTPQGPKYNAKIRVVIYAKNGVHACDQSGAFTIGATTGVGDPPPTAAGLRLAVIGQPGPLPVLVWSLPEAGPVALMLYDVRGRTVRTLVDGAAGVGALNGRAAWDGRDDAGRSAPPGIYFARLSSHGRWTSAVVVRTNR
jgi:hypothetical protein